MTPTIGLSGASGAIGIGPPGRGGAGIGHHGQGGPPGRGGAGIGHHGQGGHSSSIYRPKTQSKCKIQ